MEPFSMRLIPSHFAVHGRRAGGSRHMLQVGREASGWRSQSRWRSPVAARTRWLAVAALAREREQ
jgi:hypothetical protein